MYTAYKNMTGYVAHNILFSLFGKKPSLVLDDILRHLSLKC